MPVYLFKRNVFSDYHTFSSTGLPSRSVILAPLLNKMNLMNLAASIMFWRTNSFDDFLSALQTIRPIAREPPAQIKPLKIRRGTGRMKVKRKAALLQRYSAGLLC